LPGSRDSRAFPGRYYYGERFSKLHSLAAERAQRIAMVQQEEYAAVSGKGVGISFCWGTYRAGRQRFRISESTR